MEIKPVQVIFWGTVKRAVIEAITTHAVACQLKLEIGNDVDKEAIAVYAELTGILNNLGLKLDKPVPEYVKVGYVKRSTYHLQLAKKEDYYNFLSVEGMLNGYVCPISGTKSYAFSTGRGAVQLYDKDIPF